jgi:hypothetical protein
MYHTYCHFSVHFSYPIYNRWNRHNGKTVLVKYYFHCYTNYSTTYHRWIHSVWKKRVFVQCSYYRKYCSII